MESTLLFWNSKDMLQFFSSNLSEKKKKGLPGAKDLARSVLQHKGNLSWKHNQYLSPPAWQSKVQPWLWSLAVSFARECGVPEEFIKTGNV